MTVKHEVAVGNHLFIGGPLNGVIKDTKNDDKHVSNDSEYIVFKDKSNDYHVYEFTGYALLYRGFSHNGEFTSMRAH